MTETAIGSARALAAEFIGTFALIFIGGAGVAAQLVAAIFAGARYRWFWVQRRTLGNCDVGLLVIVAGEPASGDDPDVRPRHTEELSADGSHTYSLINDRGERFWVKFHFKTMQGIATLTNAEAAKIVGDDRESNQRDLFDAIERYDYPKWRFCVQIMAEADSDKTPYNPFDLTKVWPHRDYPLIEVGVLELNRNPQNYFAEVEQAAFEPSNVVPGISFSPDKMLQFRIFAYADAHRYRLGSPNYADLPVGGASGGFELTDAARGRGRNERGHDQRRQQRFSAHRPRFATRSLAHRSALLPGTRTCRRQQRSRYGRKRPIIPLRWTGAEDQLRTRSNSMACEAGSAAGQRIRRHDGLRGLFPTAAQ